MMRKTILTVTLLIASMTVFSGFTAQAKENVLRMSTTTSTQASGLLDVLLPQFTKDTGIRVKVIAKGTGAAIRDGEDGNVDVIFVHARGRELKFIADGHGTKRYAVMHNDFVIIGPEKDPAAIKGMKNAARALKKIASTRSRFISRGDDSGTHTKERALWRVSGVDLVEQNRTVIKKGKKKTISFFKPVDSKAWYWSIGQGMGKTLTYADEKQAYTLSDRGTYIKYKYGRKPPVDLTILCEGDKDLENPYGVIPVNPARHPHVKNKLALQFAQWIILPRAQAMINNYRLMGKQLFYPDAVKTELERNKP